MTTWDDPRVLLDRLRAARTGGVHLLDRGSTRFRPWSDVLGDVERVAVYLIESGIRPGTRVGIRGDNCYQWLVLDLALLGIGAVPVAVPIPDLAGTGNPELMRRYGMAAVFAGRIGRADTDGPAVAPLEDLLSMPPVTVARPGPPEGERSPADARPVFTLAFSSGTAGRVKCLLMYWPGVAKLIETTLAAYPVAEDDRIMIALPLSTFQQRYLCYLAITRGCEIVLTTAARYLPALIAARPTILLGPPNFYEFAEIRHRNSPRGQRLVRQVAAAPAVLLPHRALRARWRSRVYRSAHEMFGGRIRLMLVGSAPVRREMMDFFARAGLPLYQIYGMTETGYLTWNRPGADRVGSVGRECYPGSVRVDADGEVVIQHPWHISVGYEGEDEASVAAVFRGADVIATGDLGRLVDGYLELRGRKKNVIVTRGGQKLQLEDLEHDLARAAGVNRAALYPEPGRPGLAAVFWFDGDRSTVRDALRPRVQLVSSRLGAELRIGRVALIEGDLAQDSPLLNRNLKLNRDAVRAATVRHLETVDW